YLGEGTSAKPVKAARMLLRLPGRTTVVCCRAREPNLVPAVCADHVDVSVPRSVGGVGDRASVRSPGQRRKLRGSGRIAGQPVVVASVGADHVRAFAVLSAVKNVPPVRRPREPVLVVGA